MLNLILARDAVDEFSFIKSTFKFIINELNINSNYLLNVFY